MKKKEWKVEDRKGWTEAEAVSPCSLVTVSSLWMSSLSWLYEKSYYLHYRRPLSFLSVPLSLRNRGCRAASFFGGSRRAITVRMEDGRESIFLTVLAVVGPGLLSRERIQDAAVNIARKTELDRGADRTERMESKYVDIINPITNELVLNQLSGFSLYEVFPYSTR